MIQNLDRENIEKLKKIKIKQVRIIDYDILPLHSTDKIEDSIYRLIKQNFILNVFIAICTSFTFPALPNLYEINNKSCLQKIKLKQIHFNKFKQNILSTPYNRINIFIHKECMQYKLYLNKAKHKQTIKKKSSLLKYLEFNKNSYNYNKCFLEHCLNLPAETFYSFYQILKMFILYSKPIFYNHESKNVRFVFSKKRAKRNCMPIPNVYQIPLIIFNNLLKFCPKTIQYNFHKVFNVQPLKIDKFSIEYGYYSIFEIDSCIKQMNIADRIFANFQIQWCSNKCSVFDHIYDKIKHRTDYRKLDVVNYFSKRYILKQYIQGLKPNSFSFISLNEYLMLNKCLMDIKSRHEIEFKIFLDNFKTHFFNTISKRYIVNLKPRVKALSKCEFIKLFNLQFKHENVKTEYLNFEQIKKENDIDYLDELKYLYKANTISIKMETSTLSKINKIEYFKTRNDFILHNRTSLRNIAIKGKQLEIKYKLAIQLVVKICNETWVSYSIVLDMLLSKTYLSSRCKSNYIKNHILETAYKHLKCCLTEKQFEFIYSQTIILYTDWKTCARLLDRRLNDFI